MKLYSDNIELYSAMLEDMKNAKQEILLETYMFNDDNIGRKFLAAISRKAAQGVLVKVLFDDIGSNAGEDFFAPLKKNGGIVTVFRRFRFSRIEKSTHRDHRKVLVIDKKIAYIGSSNITDRSLTWKEANIRITGDVASALRVAYLENEKVSKKYIYKKHQKALQASGSTIIRDVPSLLIQKIRKKEIEIIKSAEKEVRIMTPYFLPDHRLRRALIKAVKRGVNVKVLLPKVSDVPIVDRVRSLYLGRLHRGGIVFVFSHDMIHAKVLATEKEFLVGSANLDYRSSRWQFEIGLHGKDKTMLKQLKDLCEEECMECTSFDYKSWKKRPIFVRIIERVLWSIRYLL